MSKSKKVKAMSAGPFSYFQDDGFSSRLILILQQLFADRETLDHEIKNVMTTLAKEHFIENYPPVLSPAKSRTCVAAN
jgi:hypothetical protein